MPLFRYQDMANQIIQQFKSGHYQPDERLPSIRQLSLEYQVSKGTSVRCYEALERAGWVEAREKSGFYLSPNALALATPHAPSPPEEQTPAPSPEQLAAIRPRRLDYKALGLEIVRSAGRTDQIPLGTANPYVGFPGVKRLYQLLKKEVVHEARKLDSGYLSHYQTPPGSPLLIQQLGLQLSKRGIRNPSDEIIITNGAQAAVSLALQATTREGDIVLIESPCFYGILQCLEALERQVVEIPQAATGGPDLTLLAAALKQWPVKAIIVQPTVNNPTGRSMPLADRQRLIDLANQQDIAIIEDDIFAELSYQGNAPCPLKALDTENRVLYCSSISKTITPKLRLGWLLAGRWHERCQHLQFVSKMGLPGHTQQALGHWLEAGYLNRHLRLIRRHYQKRQQQFQQAIRQYWPEEIQYQPAEGGYLAWIKLPEPCNAMALHESAQREQINITPGPLFGHQPENKQAIRINFALYENQPAYLAAIERLGALIDAQLGRQPRLTDLKADQRQRVGIDHMQLINPGQGRPLP